MSIGEAQKALPELTVDEVTVVQYGGPRCKGMCGLEFNVPAGAEVPNTYTPKRYLENKM